MRACGGARETILSAVPSPCTSAANCDLMPFGLRCLPSISLKTIDGAAPLP
jgi:hypothetical protein